MKRNIYILFTIGLFIWILPSHSVNLNTERLSNLKRLIENNIAYDSIAPIDSVIAWGQQLSPILEKENKMELSFSIRHAAAVGQNGNIIPLSCFGPGTY